MAAGIGKHKLLNAGPTEPWSIREKLCLASSVMRSGDQNWVSVSRAIKPFAEPGRPPDWFSQKHCASQYSELLETTETPKRKRGERGEVVETVEDVIVRKLTAERIEELKKLIKETQEKYRKLKKEAELIQSGHMDSKLEELWNDIVAKKKQEEEEAELKRKATDAAYQARQAAKNIPRRTSTTIGRTSVGSSSPGGEFGLGELTPTSTEEGSMGVSVGSLPSTPVSFIGIPDTPPPVPLESPLTPVMDDSPQKKTGQKATPPPSPLLSELLKKGNLLPTSPRLVNEGELSLASNHLTGSGVLMDVLPGLHGGEMLPVPGTIPASPAASGAPTLSRLLEAGPAHFAAPLASFSAAAASESPSKSLLTPIDSQATIIMMSALPMTADVPVTQQEENDSASDQHTVSMDSNDISMIIDSINKECLASSDGSLPSKDESSDSKGDLDLADKMDIAASYTGEELDFETVGDIIAIIEDKVDDHPEVLDVAAVEAALSFCEENDDPQALGGPWDQPVQDHTPKPETIAQSLLPVPKDPVCVQPDSIMNIMEMTSETKAEPPEPEVEPAKAELTPVTPHAAFQLEPTEEEITAATASEDIKEEKAEHQIKTEEPQCENSQSDAFTNEEEKGTGPEEKPVLTESVKSEPLTSGIPKDSQGEEDEEEDDVTSEVGSPEEPKEEEAGEEYLSEMDNEPPISESDDGFSIHNAQLQSHTLADSIPSSPASSQFSVCSEDQEAIQAQKIWKKAIMLVWRAAANHRYANVFLQPVTDDIAPGYHSIVQRPMDLSTIKKNIETGLIRTTAEFQRDIMLMFQNAVMYNSSDHDVYHMAVEMQRDVLEQIQQFLATQLIMQTSESGISAKSLRGRDSTRKQDASEKDSVPMGSPAFLLSLFMQPHSEQEIINRVSGKALCELNLSKDDQELIEFGMRRLVIGEASSAEETTDFTVSESNTRIESLQSQTLTECIQVEYMKVQDEMDSMKKLESTERDVESQIYQVFWKAEAMKTKDITLSQPSFSSEALQNQNLAESSHDEHREAEDEISSVKETEGHMDSQICQGLWETEEIKTTKELKSTEEQTTVNADAIQSPNSLPQTKDYTACHVSERTEGSSKVTYMEEEDERDPVIKLEKTESDEESQICDGFWKAEDMEITCDGQPTDTANVTREALISFPQDLHDNKALESINIQNMEVDDSSQCCEPSQVDRSPSVLETQDAVCERTERVIPSSLTLLELLLLNTQQSYENDICIVTVLKPIWKIIATIRFAVPFLKPVKEKQAPGYNEIVKRPMDLRTIRHRIRNGIIKTKAEFQRDVLLMLHNCIMYNGAQYIVHQKALEMQKEVVELFQVLNLQIYENSKLKE
ncbi:bromodomain-containing protein 8 isoform X2 [Hyperolius riggenbachi]|uniref:bromodomain-containing protein 8 isoform X2 n=1 Tax=Hyperolius riggenbachi TaxID=752182 RepID=UPI0035A321F7